MQTYMHGLHNEEGGDRVWTERRYTPNSKLEFYRRESHTTALADRAQSEWTHPPRMRVSLLALCAASSAGGETLGD